MNTKGYSLPIILFLLIAVSVLFVFIYRNFGTQETPFLTSQTTNVLVQDSSYVQLNGTLEQTSDLKLMQLTPDILPEDKEKEQALINATKYYKAGIYKSGSYKGYTRIIALRPFNNMVGYQDYQFATKDFKTYVLNGDVTKIEKDKKPEELTYEDPRYGLDLTKVVKIEQLPQSAPFELSLSEKYGLHQDSNRSLRVEQPSYDDLGTIRLITDTAGLKELPSPIKDFKMFAKESTKPQEELTRYISGETTGVYLVDSTGVMYSYSQTTAEGNREYKSKLAAYDKEEAEYRRKMDEINDRIAKYKDQTGKDDLVVNDYPPYPEYVYTPSFSFKSTEFKDITLNSASFFTNYRNALPTPCGEERNTYISKNISDSDLQKIGTVEGIDLYLLVNANHPLQKIAYDIKKKANDTLWDEMQHKEDGYFKRMPDFNTYLSQRPIVFIKDYWGRIAILQEDNFTVVGGCGKPVIYLYPQTPTDVSLSFTSPMSLTTQIPTYKNGWNVRANPDGELIDLQPEYTNCSLLKQVVGSEYAKSACNKNSYPYIYWAGQTHAASYPDIKSGWIVGNGEVEQTLRTKLTQIGLSEKEQNDMLEYWLPEMKKSNAPFYRISLLQNNELNKLFPMNVTPKPNSVIRVFLDYLPLSSSNSVSVEPETVEHYDRNGFTLVEWGGLHR